MRGKQKQKEKKEYIRKKRWTEEEEGNKEILKETE